MATFQARTAQPRAAGRGTQGIGLFGAARTSAPRCIGKLTTPAIISIAWGTARTASPLARARAWTAGDRPAGRIIAAAAAIRAQAASASARTLTL